MTAIEHPAWCDRALCTAPAEQPAEMNAQAGWHHVSAPVPLGLRTAGSLVLPASDGGGTVTAQLAQAVAPWRCETYLRISDGVHGTCLELALREAQQAAGILGGLLTTAGDDTRAAAWRDLAARAENGPVQ